ncbi:hypothetical protein SNE40_018384 [Patella caerulea]|uniref:Hexosyltransferase n=1 Tax=Patella caerulea TaxID=87958 RepID=A0AAN8JAL4_PATCE
MQHILYQNYKEDQGSFKKTLKSKEVENAVSLHPVKEPLYLFRIQNYFQSTKIVHLHQKELHLYREINMMEEFIGYRHPNSLQNKLALMPSLNKYKPQNDDEVLSWEFITKPIFSHFHNNPKRGLEASLSGAIDDVINQIMQLVNKNARQRGRTIDFKEILYGYRRINPLYGADYILDLLLIYRKHKGRKMTVPVRRHAYVQQSFFQTEFEEEVATYNPKPSMGAHVLHIIRQFAVGPESKPNIDKRTETIHFVMPLSGRLKIFERFMKNYEEICLLTGENAQLHVVLYKSEREEQALEESIELLQKYQNKYGGNSIEIIRANGVFSRGRGLELGASRCSKDALLFLVDVDIVMTRSSLNRIRLNTNQGSQVYFPIVFSQFDPVTVCLNHSPHCSCQHDGCHIDPLDFSQDTGYWRQFGFGIAAMYRSDMLSVGGFDLSIQGWGKEDVDLYQKYIESNITIFRSVDPGMTHAFHEIFCDTNLEPAQLVMCIGSRAQSYGAIPYLSKTVYETDSIMKRHEKHTLNVDS